MSRIPSLYHTFKIYGELLVFYNSNNLFYVTSSLKYDFLNNALLGTAWLPAVNFFTSSITKANFNNVLQVSDPKYGYTTNDVIALK